MFAPGPRACNSYSSFWLAGSTAREQDVIDYLREENRVLPILCARMNK